MDNTKSSGVGSWIGYALGVIITPLLVSRLGLTPQQTLAVFGFSVVLFGAIIFWKYRVAFAFCGVALLLALNLLDVPHLIEFAGLDIILFLVAMMTIIGFMEERLFFEWMIEQILRIVGPHPNRIMIVLMVLAAVSAALVDEVTSILFIVAAMLNLLGRAKINAIPFILMLVFTTNIGSSATVVGNPVGVIIAMRSGLSFVDFLRWATPISVVCLAVTIPICLVMFRKDLAALKAVLMGERGRDKIEQVVQDELVTKRGIRRSAWLFGCVVVGLVLHHQLENWLGLSKNTMLLGVPLMGAGIALGMSGTQARTLIEKRVDWWTLSFFMMLFASVGTLQQTGVTTVIAQRLIDVSGGDIAIMLTVFAWTSGLLSAVMDNVLAVAMYMPIINDVGESGLQTFPLWWATLFGGTLFGNLTLIGSTANIVAVGVLERRGAGEITFGQWLKYGAVVAIPTLVIANLMLLAQLPSMPHAVTVAVH